MNFLPDTCKDRTSHRIIAVNSLLKVFRFASRRISILNGLVAVIDVAIERSSSVSASSELSFLSANFVDQFNAAAVA